MNRYTVSLSAGQRDGMRYCVLDTQDKQGGKGMRRVSYHRTYAEAQKAAKRCEAIAQQGYLHEGFHGPLDTEE